MYESIQRLEETLVDEARKIKLVKEEIHKVIVGQDKMIERAIMALLTGGHILLEGLPGLGKTLTVNTLAQTVKAKFTRIQFTPDLLPADLIGTNIYDSVKGVFIPKKGPLFSNIVLADEINRAPAKVQSALLEVMQEKQITLAGETHKLEFPFLVMATQNRIDQEGTYSLPEAQVDRFMMKLLLDYPSKEEEYEILNRVTTFEHNYKAEPILEIDDLRKIGQLCSQVYVDDKIKRYIVEIVDASRNPKDYNLPRLAPLLETGTSPRATIAMSLSAQAYAMMQGRGYVSPQDIKEVAADVLRHRIMISYEAIAENISEDEIISDILSEIPIP